MLGNHYCPVWIKKDMHMDKFVSQILTPYKYIQFIHVCRVEYSKHLDLLPFVLSYGSAEGPPRGVENRNLLSHPDDLRMEVYVIRMT